MATDWAESLLGTSAHMPLTIWPWIVSIAAEFLLGIIVGAIFLMLVLPRRSAAFSSTTSRSKSSVPTTPLIPSAVPPPMLRAVPEGVRPRLLAILVYLVAVPFLLFAGLGVVIFFLATAYLLGREYFELAAMRHQPPAEAKGLRKRRTGTVFVAGC